MEKTNGRRTIGGIKRLFCAIYFVATSLKLLFLFFLLKFGKRSRTGDASRSLNSSFFLLSIKTPTMYFFFFLLYPVSEIIVFILVAKALGWTSTLLLALATSFVGATLLRSRSIKNILTQPRGSAPSIENYLFINLGCFLLILPGFLTDVLGLAVMTPVCRKALLAFLRFCRIDLGVGAQGPFSVFRAYRFGDGFNFPANFNGNFNENFSDASEDAPIDVDAISPQNGDSNVSKRDDDFPDDEPIDVEFTVRK